jgi:hypothetical protein
MPNAKVVSITAQLSGGRQIEKEASEGASGVKKLGESVKKADDEAGKASKGWALFSHNVKKAGDESKKTHSLLKGLIGAGAGLVGGYVGLSGLKDVLNTTSSLAEETHKFHSITGMGASSSLDYVAALKARGIGAQAGGNAFKFLAKNIQAAERQEHTFGVGQAKAAAKGKQFTTLLGVQAGAFKTLGLNVSEFGRLKPEKQFEVITSKFEDMTNGAEKSRLAVQLFGRGGTALLPVLEKGTLGLKHQYEMAKKFFPTLKGEGVKGLEELQEKQAESKMAWEGIEFTLGQKLVPAVTAVMGWFSKLTIEVREGKGWWGHLGKAIGTTAEDLGTAWKWLEKTKGAATALKVALGLLAAAWGVEKIVKFYRAVKSLWLLQTIAKGAGGVWRRVGTEAAENAAGGLSSSGAASKWRGAGNFLGKALGAGAAVFIGVEIAKEMPNIVQGIGNALGLSSTGMKGSEKQSLKDLFGKNLGEKLGEAGPTNRFKILRENVKHHIPGAASALKYEIDWFHQHHKAIPKLGWGGTIRHAGSVIVGDRGPEVLSLPPAARVDPLANQTRGPGSIIGGFTNSANGDLHVHVEVAGREIAQAVFKEFKREQALA